MQNRQRYAISEGPRGIIYDSQNRIMAYNAQKSMVIFFIDKSRVKEQKETLAKFVKLVYYDRPNKLKILEGFIKKLLETKENKIILGSHLTQKESTRFSYWEFCLPDIKKNQTFLRRYKFNYSCGNLIGYLAKQDNLSEIQFKDIMLKPKKIYYSPHIYKGIHGIEKAYENHLSGSLGLEVLEVDSVGRFISSAQHTIPKPGKNLTLSINAQMQEYIAKQIGGKSGACVVIDISTGQILSMVSEPSFNSNKMIAYDEDEDLGIESRSLITESSFIDKTIRSFYPPASTIKPFISAAAAECGIDPYKTVKCTGRYKINNRYFHCHKKEGHGKVNMIEAVAVSCNAFFYDLATKLSIDSVSKIIKKFGISDDVGLEALNIIRGTFPTSKSSVQAKQGKWTNGFTANTFIGQGFAQWTPMHMAISSARVASGYKVEARILKDEIRRDFDEMPLSEKCIQMAQQCMEAPFTHKRGILRNFDSKNPKYQLAGKTGTAQVISQNIDNKDSVKLAGSKKSAHSLFVGYAPRTDPKISISFILEHESFGIRSLPRVLNIVRHIMDHYPD